MLEVEDLTRTRAAALVERKVVEAQSRPIAAGVARQKAPCEHAPAVTVVERKVVEAQPRPIAAVAVYKPDAVLDLFDRVQFRSHEP
jgi:hypothetical protein